MRVFITGGTGFIGQAAIEQLRGDGHTAVVWTRNPEQGRSRLGEGVDVVGPDAELADAVQGTDAVLNLAGEPVLPGRWTPAKKEKLVSSRVDLTRRIVAAMAPHAGRGPRVLVSASGVGYYGEGPIDDPCPEDRGPGDDFLARLCVDWEAAARAAEPQGVRVACVRIGFVLGADGGALKQLLPPFQMGVGGRIASGTQMVPWIHIQDLARMLVAALTDADFPPVVNGTAPDPVSNSTFTQVLGQVLGRPTIFPVPSFALRMAFGEAAGPLLGGQNARPEAALKHGFGFDFDDLERCLRDVLRRPK